MFRNLWSNFDSNLFDEFRRLESEMDQLFGRGSTPAGIRAVRRGTFPPINVGSTPERVDVYVFAAGFDPKNVDISIQQTYLLFPETARCQSTRRLTITGGSGSTGRSGA